MSVISVFAIISVVLLFIGFWVSLITDFDSYIGIIILFCGLILAGITYFAGIHNKEVINTETEVIETESTESIITEDDSETVVNETKDFVVVLVVIVSLFMAVIVLTPIILCIVESGFLDDVVYDIKEPIRAFKEKKRLKTETKTEQKEEASSDTSKEVFTNTEKMLKNIASSNSKVDYILWAVNYLDENGKTANTRKLKNYYIPEILKAQAQFKKIKDYGMDEMTTEAKKHYKKIISLAYSVAKAEVKKAASEILMDMDCNADVCENIYKNDGYSSMQEEIQESHTAEKKKEQTLHAKTISKDTYVFWTSEE